MAEVTSAEPSLSIDIDAYKVDLNKMIQAFWDERPSLKDEYSKFVGHTNPLTKSSMLLAYMAGADDAMKFLARGIKKGQFNL